MTPLFFRSIGPRFATHLQSLKALDAGGMNTDRHRSTRQTSYCYVIFSTTFPTRWKSSDGRMWNGLDTLHQIIVVVPMPYFL